MVSCMIYKQGSRTGIFHSGPQSWDENLLSVNPVQRYHECHTTILHNLFRSSMLNFMLVAEPLAVKIVKVSVLRILKLPWDVRSPFGD
jgi:hypothetical protein